MEADKIRKSSHAAFAGVQDEGGQDISGRLNRYRQVASSKFFSSHQANLQLAHGGGIDLGNWLAFIRRDGREGCEILKVLLQVLFSSLLPCDRVGYVILSVALSDFARQTSKERRCEIFDRRMENGGYCTFICATSIGMGR